MAALKAALRLPLLTASQRSPGGSTTTESRPAGRRRAQQRLSQQLTQQPAYNSEEIAANYAQASNLLLKERNLEGAVAAFKQHIPISRQPLSGQCLLLAGGDIPA